MNKESIQTTLNEIAEPMAVALNILYEMGCSKEGEKLEDALSAVFELRDILTK